MVVCQAQSEDCFNILLIVRPSRIPPESSEEYGGLDTSSPESPRSLEARRHLRDPSLLQLVSSTPWAGKRQAPLSQLSERWW